MGHPTRGLLGSNDQKAWTQRALRTSAKDAKRICISSFVEFKSKSPCLAKEARHGAPGTRSSGLE